RHPDVVARGLRSARRLRPPREQLRPEAGQLRPVRPGRPPARAVLDGAERSRAAASDGVSPEEDAMAKILMLVSSAKVIRLADGTPQPTGYFVDEAIKPYDRFIAAGASVLVATSDGQTPHPDPYGLEHYFHYPDEDEDFLASVMRTFKR